MKEISPEWVLNQLAGMKFPEPGQAYDFIKKCLGDQPRDARATVGEVESDGFVRTSILMKEGTTESIDVMGQSGNRLCRLNISEYDLGTGGNVDVILDGKQKCTVATFGPDGKRNIAVPPLKLTSVSFSSK